MSNINNSQIFSHSNAAFYGNIEHKIVDTPRFDQSDFPALGNTNPNNSENNFGFDDFPALGGTTNNNNNNNNNDNIQSLNFNHLNLNDNLINSGANMYDNNRPITQPLQRASSTPPSTNTFHNNNTTTTTNNNNNNFRAGSDDSKPLFMQQQQQQLQQNNNNDNNNYDCGKYGLDNLCEIINLKGTQLNMLTMGMDLTALGMNPAQREVLYAKFAYPTLDNPMKNTPDHVLPYCYYMQPPPLKTSHLSKFKLETLFYIFYNMTKDMLQVYAATELYNRGWRYHKSSQRWVTNNRNSSMPFMQQQESWEYFNVANWKKESFVPPQTPSWPMELMSSEEFSALTK